MHGATIKTGNGEML